MPCKRKTNDIRNLRLQPDSRKQKTISKGITVDGTGRPMGHNESLSRHVAVILYGATSTIVDIPIIMFAFNILRNPTGLNLCGSLFVGAHPSICNLFSWSVVVTVQHNGMYSSSPCPLPHPPGGMNLSCLSALYIYVGTHSDWMSSCVGLKLQSLQQHQISDQLHVTCTPALA